MSAALEFERMPYLTVSSMSAESARKFATELTGHAVWFKVVCAGQSKNPRQRFGARVYKLFANEADWLRYQRERRDGRWADE